MEFQVKVVDTQRQKVVVDRTDIPDEDGVHHIDLGCPSRAPVVSTEDVPIRVHQSGSSGSLSSAVPVGEGFKKKRLIYFSDGVLDADELEENVNTSMPESLTNYWWKGAAPEHMKWGRYLWFYLVASGIKAVSVCDTLGEKLAWFLGITSPKFHYAIEEHERMQQEKEEFEMEERVSSELSAATKGAAETTGHVVSQYGTLSDPIN